MAGNKKFVRHLSPMPDPDEKNRKHEFGANMLNRLSLRGIYQLCGTEAMARSLTYSMVVPFEFWKSALRLCVGVAKLLQSQ